MIRRLLVPLLFFCPLLSLAATDDAGTIKTVRGDVRIERAGSGIEARVGEPVFAGDRVRVTGEGAIGISMRDETLLSLGPNSTMVVNGFAYNPTTREGAVETSILRGTMRYITGLIGRRNPEAIKVNTPTATIGIRGTDFIVEVSDER
jgi:hypothetical protein